mmetsp:Transcript_78381/g.123781  ORF Transcript_78381/g.123781 Transcript_78381/m.123781 type:complete len:245 (+) Transcript_78381:2-736(+)
MSSEARELSALDGLSPTRRRQGFIQKVYGILGTQLLITIAIGYVVMTYAEDWLKTNPSLVMALLWGSLALSISIMCAATCCPDTLRVFPQNYILLFVFTIAESVMVGFICVQYTKESVLIGLAITALVVLALTLFACQTSVDFTGLGPYLFVFLMVLCGFGLALAIASMCGLHGEAFQTLRMLYAAGGALLFSVYLVYDTQLIVGGDKHAQAFQEDDYCWAAINLYIDIIQLFLYLLELFGSRR